MDKLRWGVLSTAKIGVKKVIPAMQAGQRCSVVAIASRNIAAALDAVDQSRGWLDQVRDLAGHNPRVRALVEQLIAHKQRLFGNDHRLIGRYQLFRRQGELRLKAEARRPRLRR